MICMRAQQNMERFTQFFPDIYKIDRNQTYLYPILVTINVLFQSYGRSEDESAEFT